MLSDLTLCAKCLEEIVVLLLVLLGRGTEKKMGTGCDCWALGHESYILAVGLTFGFYSVIP